MVMTVVIPGASQMLTPLPPCYPPCIWKADGDDVIQWTVMTLLMFLALPWDAPDACPLFPVYSPYDAMQLTWGNLYPHSESIPFELILGPCSDGFPMNPNCSHPSCYGISRKMRKMPKFRKKIRQIESHSAEKCHVYHQANNFQHHWGWEREVWTNTDIERDMQTERQR